MGLKITISKKLSHLFSNTSQNSTSHISLSNLIQREVRSSKNFFKVFFGTQNQNILLYIRRVDHQQKQKQPKKQKVDC